MDYADGSGTNAFRATASATVTIQIVESQLTISGLPTAGAPGDTAALPADQAGASGNTLNYLYALTANANGDDIYDLDVSITTATDVSGETVSWTRLAADGTTPIGGGAPGDVVEHRVTVSNAGSNAKNVIATDQIPPYTTLVSDAFGATFFAQAIRDGGTPVLLSTTADDDEDSSVASGNAAGTAAGSALNFYVGPSNKDSTDKGGDLPNGSAVEIFYQVTID
jgi:uncharacterized repeat protein (TIGR01451 family)